MSSVQRFRHTSPCPVCGGYDEAPRGHGQRCYGFLADDGRYAHCTREEYAAGLPLEPESPTYAHRLVGDCRCGVRPDPRAPQPSGQAERRIVARYPYRDEQGRLLYEVVRYEPKTFKQRRPDGYGQGGWLWNLNGTRRVLYRLRELSEAVKADRTIFLPEGEKDVDALVKRGLDATTNSGGAKKFPADQARYLAGADVVILEDHDADGRQHSEDLYGKLSPVVKSLKRLAFPDLANGGDISDWLMLGHTTDDLLALVAAAPAYEPHNSQEAGDESPPGEMNGTPPLTLTEVVQVFQRWLDLPDPGFIEILLGAYVANLIPGDPVWLLGVGPSSGGKTEPLLALTGLPHMHLVSTFTEGSLLSGTPMKDKAKGAQGGLLRAVGPFGYFICKDFTSVLSMQDKIRMSTVAALREIYDGKWDRPLGIDGGRVLSWHGKLAMLAGCTDTIDSHYVLMAAMGQRFFMFRLPSIDAHAQAEKAFDTNAREQDMRADLRGIVARFFKGRTFGHMQPTASKPMREHLIQLAMLTVVARSPVERDPRKRDITLIPDPEAPARAVKVIGKLWAALRAIGIPDQRAW